LLGEPVEAAEDLYRAMRELEPWDKGSHYRAIATSLFWNLRLRGQLGESWRLIERLEGGSGRSPGLSIIRDYLAWWLGYPARGEAEVAEDLRRIERWPASDRGKVLETLVALRVCKGDVGAETEELLARSKEGALSTRRLGLWDRMGVLVEAELRVEQWRQAPDARRREARRRARAALRRLRRHARRAPLLRAHLVVLESAALQLSGRPRRALRRSETAVRLARSIDAPVVRFRAMQQAAQALQVTGQRHAAQGEAKLAMSLASQHGWVGPARQMREEFRLDRTSLSTPSAGGSSPHLRSSESSGTGSSTVGHRDSRHLDALLRVTAASANVLDPRRLARVALDQMLGILGAERAYLFVVDDHDEALEMFAGRDAQGKDITDMTGYSTTVVERCRAEQEAFIVTGTEEGAAMGSKSAVHHGLRSMLAAPLQLDGKLLGVIYLDSRLAKGVFTQEDVDILVAIAKQVAVSLTTARSAQLESMVTAERQQRVLAEALRDVMTEAAATLDPVEVLSRTLATAQRAVNYDAACVLVSQPDGAARVAAARGAVDADAIDTTVAAHGVLNQVIAGQAMTDRDTTDTPPLPGAQLQPKSWLAVPIALGDTVAAVVMGSATDGAYGPSQVEIASTLVSQVAVAYQNASMFTEIERLAVTDELSGLANRRSFFEQAIREFEEAKRLGRDLSAVMLDIDHFKPINDTLGHAVGDEVIRHVGKRLAELARGDDIVGRYGGEEFALIITAGRGPAMRLAERLRSAVEEEVIPAGDSTVKITVSVGVAVLTPQDNTLEDLLVRADAALYEAKQAGRNLVIAA
jgi:eukaryotic-like serine/threonine-protein kinase